THRYSKFIKRFVDQTLTGSRFPSAVFATPKRVPDTLRERSVREWYGSLLIVITKPRGKPTSDLMVGCST
ncbi:MAG: hypothetical protein ACK56I_37495, partial [bacterium]